MELDFTGLSGIPVAEASTPAQGAGKLQRIADKAQGDKEAAAEVYKQHQTATIRAGQLVTEIRKGILSGHSVYDLLLKAIKAIELSTGESGLAAQAEADIIAVYGYALGERQPLQMELANVENRLQKLSAAAAAADAAAAERIRRAIREHERERDSIIKRMERDG